MLKDRGWNWGCFANPNFISYTCRSIKGTMLGCCKLQIEIVNKSHHQRDPGHPGEPTPPSFRVRCMNWLDLVYGVTSIFG